MSENYYVSENDLYYELVLSKGKGKLTRKAEKYFILIANRTILRKERDYKDQDEKNDCLQQGLLSMFSNWKNFNEEKYSVALPYLTEIFKRGIADGYNQLYNKKPYQKFKPKMISIDSTNDGKGLHNIK